MIKNDYRRDMILLRPLEDGISGFCRLEARVSRGSITYNIRAQRSFGGRLMAVLAGVRNGRWQAAAGGEIRADALGQAGYYWEFDPRAINSLALENYALIGVAVDGADARLLLAGKQDKGCIIDWEAAERAVHELLAPSSLEAARAPKADLSGADASDASGGARPSTDSELKAAPDTGRTTNGATQARTVPDDAADMPSQDSAQQAQTASDGASDAVQSYESMSDGAQPPDEAVRTQPAPGSSSCGMCFEMCDSGAQERSRMIRVLGASIAGEKDCELDDDALERVIAQALRGVMGKLGLNEDGGLPPASAEPDGVAELPASAQPDDIAEPPASAQPDDSAEPPVSAQPDGAAEPNASAEPPADVKLTDEEYISPDAALSEADEARMAQALLDEQERYHEGNMMQSTTAPQSDGHEPEHAEPSVQQVGESAHADAPNDAYTPNDASAAEPWLLEGLCAQERPWPECCAELKPLFSKAVRACPLDEPGFVFVRAPMAGGGSCAVGVKCEGGMPAEVMYLIPGRYAAVPPAGLEGYVWREGEGGGFWMARQDAYTGAMLFDR